jgi:ribosomal protein S1
MLMTRIWRRADESVTIGDEIVVTVLKVAFDHVRLAISCSGLTPSYWEETLYLLPAEEMPELELTGTEN